MLTQLLIYPVAFHEDDLLSKEAHELAVRFNRPRAHDSLADRLQCYFWITDERMVNSVQAQFSHIHRLGSRGHPRFNPHPEIFHCCQMQHHPISR